MNVMTSHDARANVWADTVESFEGALRRVSGWQLARKEGKLKGEVEREMGGAGHRRGMVREEREEGTDSVGRVERGEYVNHREREEVGSCGDAVP